MCAMGPSCGIVGWLNMVLVVLMVRGTSQAEESAHGHPPPVAHLKGVSRQSLLHPAPAEQSQSSGPDHGGKSQERSGGAREDRVSGT